MLITNQNDDQNTYFNFLLQSSIIDCGLATDKHMRSLKADSAHLKEMRQGYQLLLRYFTSPGWLDLIALSKRLILVSISTTGGEKTEV